MELSYFKEIFWWHPSWSSQKKCRLWAVCSWKHVWWMNIGVRWVGCAWIQSTHQAHQLSNCLAHLHYMPVKYIPVAYRPQSCLSPDSTSHTHSCMPKKSIKTVKWEEIELKINSKHPYITLETLGATFRDANFGAILAGFCPPFQHFGGKFPSISA